MEKLKAISPFQLFSVMFISSIFSAMMYSKHMVKELNLLMYAVSALVCIAVMFAVTIPLVIFAKRSDDSNIIKAIQTKKPMLSGVFTYVYAHYFMYSAVVSLMIFSLLLGNFINPGISFFAFFTLALLCCYYAAFKGLTAIARSSTIFLVMILFSLVFVCASLFLKIDVLNYSDIFLEDGSGIVRNSTLITAQASAVPAVFLFVHRIKGSLKKPLYLWILLSNIAVFLLSLISFGVIGDYLLLTEFPFYTATQLTEIGAFQRLDVIFLALWTVGMFVNITLSLFALRETIQTSFKANKVKYLNPLSVIFVGIWALVGIRLDAVRHFLFDDRVMLVLFLTVSFIFPIIAVLCLGKKKISSRKAKAAVCAVLALLLIPFLTACENVQLQERLLIKGIGIDKSGSGYDITVQYIDNYSEDEGQSNKSIKVSGNTVAEAMGNIRNKTGSEPFLGQNVAVVVGWETAKGDMQSLLDYFVRYCDSRPTVKLYLSETKAEDILTLEVGGKLIPIDNVSTISPSGSGYENFFTLLNFIIQSKDPMDTPTASVLRVNENSIMLSSVAVFGGRSGLYTLDEKQLLSYKIANGIGEGSIISTDGISCEITDSSAVINAKEVDGKLNFSVFAKLSVTVLENPNNLSGDGIERCLNESLKRLLSESMKKTLNENQSDIYRLGRNLRFNDYKLYSDKERYHERLSDCELKVSVDCKAVNTV